MHKTNQNYWRTSSSTRGSECQMRYAWNHELVNIKPQDVAKRTSGGDGMPSAYYGSARAVQEA